MRALPDSRVPTVAILLLGAASEVVLNPENEFELIEEPEGDGEIRSNLSGKTTFGFSRSWSLTALAQGKRIVPGKDSRFVNSTLNKDQMLS
ncbi:hypothetical protein BASA81_012084 [Batrachochytrium salamandrivorans]|nr:hypothetical protein BASA81_012084 [Batrachochytrium salamandrivorans]